VAIKTNSFVDRASHVGVVFRQQPTAGSAAPHGSVDTLIVGMTPPIAAVPPSQSSQALLPRPRASDTAASPQVASPPAPIEPDEPMDWSWLWKAAVVVGVLLAVVAAVIRVKDKRRLAALRVTPYQHSGRPRVVAAKRND
jgi:hypothetical protein